MQGVAEQPCAVEGRRPSGAKHPIPLELVHRRGCCARCSGTLVRVHLWQSSPSHCVTLCLTPPLADRDVLHVQPLFNSILGFNLKASTALSHTTVSVSAIASSLYGFYQVRMHRMLSGGQSLQAGCSQCHAACADFQCWPGPQVHSLILCAGLRPGTCCRRAPTTRPGPWQIWIWSSPSCRRCCWA